MKRFVINYLERNGYSSVVVDFETMEEAMLTALDWMVDGTAIGWELFDFFDAGQKETVFDSIHEYPVIAQSSNWHTLI